MSSRVRMLAVFAGAVVAAAGCSGRGDKAVSEKPAPGAADSTALPAPDAGTYLHLVAPSVVERGSEFSLRLRLITYAGIPDYDLEGTLKLRFETLGRSKFPDGGPKLEPVEGGYYEAPGIRLDDLGVQLIRGIVPDDTVAAVANPVNVVEKAEWRVFWGDVDGHSDLSSGDRAPEVYWWYASAVALLDFAALTDNDRWQDKVMDDSSFAEMADVTAEFDEPGDFVALLGFEWTSPEHGDRLVYFSERPPSLPTPASGVDTPAKLRAAVPKGSVIAIAHPSGSEKDVPVDPAEAGMGGEEIVEIYSQVGVFERPGSHRPAARETAGASVVDLMARGFRPGFIAASDTRLSIPGNPRPVLHGDHRYPGGLTAVLAKELTRAAVLDALRARRCYATTGQRALLEFTVDGQPMGSDIRVARGHVAEAYGSLGSTMRWTRVEVVAPTGAIGVLTPPPESADVVELRAKTAPVTEPTWVYLRAVDERGDMAWSSPVYLTPQ